MGAVKPGSDISDGFENLVVFCWVIDVVGCAAVLLSG